MKSAWNLLWRYTLGAAVSVLLSLLLLLGFFRPFRVSGQSMAPTLGDRDLILVDRWAFRLGGPQRGDLVILTDPSGSGFLVKRVAGLPGDHPEALPASAGGVPDGFLYCVGDNAAESLDSRHLGPFPMDRVYGRVLVRIPERHAARVTTGGLAQAIGPAAPRKEPP
ncbi:MAG: signal peptidase I [Acidobacteriota bacterium]